MVFIFGISIESQMEFKISYRYCGCNNIYSPDCTCRVQRNLVDYELIIIVYELRRILVNSQMMVSLYFVKRQ